MYQFAGNSIGKASLSAADLRISPFSYAAAASRPISGWRGAIKRIIDVVVALLGLAFSRYPCWRSAWPSGWKPRATHCSASAGSASSNAGFEMWKFRTMHQHASEPGRLIQATRHDKRVTRLGIVLRATLRR